MREKREYSQLLLCRIILALCEIFFRFNEMKWNKCVPCKKNRREKRRISERNKTRKIVEPFFCSEWDLTVDVACDFFLLPIDTKHTVNWPWLTKSISSHMFLSSDATPTDLDSSSQPVKMSKDAPLIPGCPLCDSSVFSYCDVKIYHDACWWVVAITCWCT